MSWKSMRTTIALWFWGIVTISLVAFLLVIVGGIVYGVASSGAR